MGKAVSQFDAPWANYPGNNFDGLVGGGGTVTGVNQFTYTAEFGNGVSASIRLQDPTPTIRPASSTWQRSACIGVDFWHRRLRLERYRRHAISRHRRSWSVSTRLGVCSRSSVAAHDNHAAYYGCVSETTGHPDDKWGWAVQSACRSRTSRLVPGDTINIPGVYTDGATRYNFQDLAARQVRPRCTAAQRCLEPTRASDSLLLLTACSSPAAASQNWSRPGVSWCLHPQLESVLEHRASTVPTLG